MRSKHCLFTKVTHEIHTHYKQNTNKQTNTHTSAPQFPTHTHKNKKKNVRATQAVCGLPSEGGTVCFACNKNKRTDKGEQRAMVFQVMQKLSRIEAAGWALVTCATWRRRIDTRPKGTFQRLLFLFLSGWRVFGDARSLRFGCRARRGVPRRVCGRLHPCS